MPLYILLTLVLSLTPSHCYCLENVHAYPLELVGCCGYFPRGSVHFAFILCVRVCVRCAYYLQLQRSVTRRALDFIYWFNTRKNCCSAISWPWERVFATENEFPSSSSSMRPTDEYSGPHNVYLKHQKVETSNAVVTHHTLRHTHVAFAEGWIQSHWCSACVRKLCCQSLGMRKKSQFPTYWPPALIFHCVWCVKRLNERSFLPLAVACLLHARVNCSIVSSFFVFPLTFTSSGHSSIGTNHKRTSRDSFAVRTRLSDAWNHKQFN